MVQWHCECELSEWASVYVCYYKRLKREIVLHACIHSCMRCCERENDTKMCLVKKATHLHKYCVCIFAVYFFIGPFIWFTERQYVWQTDRQIDRYAADTTSAREKDQRQCEWLLNNKTNTKTSTVKKQFSYGRETLRFSSSLHSFYFAFSNAPKIFISLIVLHRCGCCNCAWLCCNCTNRCFQSSTFTFLCFEHFRGWKESRTRAESTATASREELWENKSSDEIKNKNEDEKEQKPPNRSDDRKYQATTESTDTHWIQLIHVCMVCVCLLCCI